MIQRHIGHQLERQTQWVSRITKGPGFAWIGALPVAIIGGGMWFLTVINGAISIPGRPATKHVQMVTKRYRFPDCVSGGGRPTES